MTNTVYKVFIQLSTYHDSIVGRIVYTNPDNDRLEESSLYSLSEINNIITLWKMNKLCGSFAIGHSLADNASIELMQ